MKKLILIAFCCAFAMVDFRPIHIFMIGDSTMANKPERSIPEYGWGQVLHYFFNDSIVVDNHAKNGRSSKSFINEGKWETVINHVQKGDYVIIQFGHNDSKPDSARYSSPFEGYMKNLEKFIVETRGKGGIPILCTPIVRRHFNDNGTLIDTHGDYLIAVKQVAEKTGVYFIDMETKTKKIVEEMGKERSKQLYLFFESKIYPQRPVGKEDPTHLSQLGAFTTASLAVEGMKELGVPVISYLGRK